MHSQIRKILSGVSFSLVIIIGLSACGSKSDDNAMSVDTDEVRDAVTGGIANALAAANTSMEPVDFSTWENRRKAVAPEILVVDMWASWCTPCLERFPAMVEMSERYVLQGVKFVSLSVDDREDPSSIAYANEFLSKQNARFDHYFLDENIIDGMNKLGVQGVPAVDIYGRDGRLAHRLTGDDPNKQFTEQDIENAIVAMLKK